MVAILSIITIISIFFSVSCFIRTQRVHKETEEINLQIEEDNQKLTSESKVLKEGLDILYKEYGSLKESISNSTVESDSLRKEIKDKREQLKEIQETINSTLDSQKNLSRQAFQDWWGLLEKDYQDKEKEYESLLMNLQKGYAEAQEAILIDLDEKRAELEKVESTRAAAIEAQRREKEISEQLSFYCLSTTPNELDDIKRLERIKQDLHNPRILSMLIWQTYWQKPMTKLCNDVLGSSTITGIYKITNQLTGECYVGQSVDTASRWKQHAKCGCGIDTPAGNKLYKAMIEDGIWNFSWELLEQCSKVELDEKEKFYINLYKSYDFGYNSTKGNN